ncbi:MAG TPA: M48 family metallopeptidase [Gammaproteobacteria bacterium]|nr:M48 family metallopeptidase [Gammaproteobacteria bacterium]
MRHIGRFLNAFAAILLGAAAFAIGTTANAQFSTTKGEVERAHRVRWLQMKRELPRPANPDIQPFVECVARRVITTLDEPYASMNWEIIVFDDEAVNAEVLLGGKISILSGLLRVTDTEDALAAVIGHEIGHLTENHVAERTRRQLGADMLATAGGAVTGMYDTSRAATTLGIMFPFGRAEELEADKVGLSYMAAAGFDPRAALQLWKNMASQRSGPAPAEFTSTHPSDDTRLHNIAQSIVPALIKYNAALETGNQRSCLPPRQRR